MVGNVLAFDAEAICVRCYILGLGCRMLGSTHMERCSGKAKATCNDVAWREADCHRINNDDLTSLLILL